MDAWVLTLARVALLAIAFLAAAAVLNVTLRQMMDSFINQLSISEACSKKGLIYHNRKCRNVDEVLGERQQ